MNSSGQVAEIEAAEWLRCKGYSIRARNWRTPGCEIDIIASRDNVLYFIEVKYRKNESQGDGLAYITSSKSRRMYRAAQLYMQQKNYQGSAQVAAMSLTGVPPVVEQFIQNVWFDSP